MTGKCDNLFFGSNLNRGRRSEEPQVWDEGFQFALHVLLPVTIAALIWGRKAIISRLLLHLDRSCISVFCPSFSKREKLLKWISTYLPYLEGGFGAIWSDGSQLCTIINSVIPGACTNPHRHWKKNPSHGQALAYKYLGVIPIFTEVDLNQRILTPTIEKTLIEYLGNLQQAILKITPREDFIYTNQYVARGMGLVTGEQNRKTILYIYANNKNKYVDDLLINIRGPYNIYGAATLLGDELSKYLIPRNKKTVTKNALTDRKRRKSFFESISSDFSNLLVPKREVAYDIEIKIEMEIGRAKVTFIPKYSGVFEICLTTNGEHITGSPYNINIEKNTSGIIDNLHDDKKRCIRKFPLSASTEDFKPRLLPILRSKTDGYFKNFNIYEDSFEFHFRDEVDDLKLDERAEKSLSSSEIDEDICYLLLNECDINSNEICTKNDDFNKNNTAIAQENLVSNDSTEIINSTNEKSNDEPDFKSIKEIKSKLECYNPDLLVGHTDFNITQTAKKASPVLKNTAAQEVEATNFALKSSDPIIFPENIPSESPQKNKLQKTNAIDHDDLTTRNLPNLLSDLENKAFDSMSSEESFDAKLYLTKRIEFWNNKVSSEGSLDLSKSLNDLKNYSSNRVLTKVKSLEAQVAPDFINNRRRLHRSHSYSSVDDLNFPSVKDRKSLFLKGWNSKTCNKRAIKEKVSIKEKIKLFDNGCVNESKNLDVILESNSVKTKIREGFEKAQHFFKELENKNNCSQNSFRGSNQSLIITNRNRSISENDVRKRSLKQAKSLDVINVSNFKNKRNISAESAFKANDVYSTKLQPG